MKLRAATETDLPGIRDVANRSLAASYDDVLDADARQRAVDTWYSTEETTPGAPTDELGDERSVVIVAEDDDEITGFAQASLVGADPRVGQIEWLHVRPDRRGEGVAGRLLDEIESVLVERGADRIEARVIEANEVGRSFYETYGYETAHTRQVELAGERVTELTLVADHGTEAAEQRTERRETEDGDSVVVAYDERERGTDGPFHRTYRDEDRTEPYGWHCGVCDSLDVNVGSMDEFVCENCGNRRRPMRWDAVYGG